MKILVLSDLHLEFQPFEPPAADVDVVVLAGDIHTRQRGIEWAAKTFGDVPVVYVTGNHEFYGAGKFNNAIADMRLTARRLGVHFLEHDAAEIEGVRFLGAALWTDFDLFGPENADRAAMAAGQCMADFNSAIWDFTPAASVGLHKAAVSWLRKRLDEPFDGPTVVVTHHAPARGSIHPRYANDLVCAGFVSDLEHMMGLPKLWIHGHCHDSFDYEAKGTRVVCNPRGYLLASGNSENPDFNPCLTVEI